MIHWFRRLGHYCKRLFDGSCIDGHSYQDFFHPSQLSHSSVLFEPLEERTLLSAVIQIQDHVDDLINKVTTSNSDAPIYAPYNPVISGDFSIQSNVSGPSIRIDDFRNDNRFAGIDGSGFAAVIMDTGIDLDDPFFGPDANTDGISDRIVYTQDFTGGGNPGDVHGHGSNVSSIVASSDATYTGMAPGADIIHLKVLADNGSGNFGWLESGLQWVIANANTYNIASINLSLGDSGNYGAYQALYGISDELAALSALDVITVASAGNSFFSFGSAPGVAYPAADVNTISVGAVYDSNVGGTWTYGDGAKAFTTDVDRITPFSQRHTTLADIFAPGAPITGAGPGAGLVTQHGTSQAGPHVAGVAVLAQQLAVQELGRRLTFSEFRTLLNDTGVTINDGDDENDNVVNTNLNFKRIDVVALAEGILDMAPPPASAPEIDVTDNGTPVADGTGSVVFGDAAEGLAVTKTFTVTNQGDATLTLDSGSLSVPSGFSVASGFGAASLAPGQSTTFAIQLDATSSGNYNGTVSFTNNDADESTYDFTVTGTVLDSVIIDDLESGFSTTGSWSTWVHSLYGYDGEHTYTASGDGSKIATWTFNSLATGQYRVSSSWVEGSNRATDSPFTLYDGATAITTVDINQELAPNDRTVSGANWEDLGTISVTGSSLRVELTNDADDYVVADGILIERIGDLPAGPEITVTDASGGLIADGSGSIDFGSTNLNTAVTQTFTVVNEGNSTLTLNNGSFVLPSGFSLASGFGTTSLTTGQSTSFTVQLDATSPGNYSGTVSFTNNDADEGTYDFSVTGVVTAQRIIDDLDSGFTTTGVWSTWVHSQFGHDGEHTYTASGDGSRIAAWTFNSLTTGQYRVSATWFESANRATDSPFTLYDGAIPVTTVDINQQVAPDDRTVSGSDWEDLGIVSVTGSSLRVELTNDADGYVVADGILIERIGDLPAGPEITVTDANGGLVADGSGNVDFGSTNLNTAVTHTFTVVNAGNSTLTLNNGSFVLPSGFSLASGFGSTSLNPGQSTTFAVQLDAASPGNYSGTASFTNNDADEGTYDFTVSGVVTAQRIIDDLDSGFMTTGAWSTWVHSLYGYDGEHTYTASGDGSRIATWTFNSLTTGQYRVSTSWVEGSNRATDSPFTLYDGIYPRFTVDINQEVAPNDRMVNGANWEDLGIISVTGSTLTVELTNDADDYVVADGILIERIGDLPTGAEITVTDANGAVVADGSGSVDFGSTNLNTAATETFTVTNAGNSTLTLNSGSFVLPSGFSLASGFGATLLSPGQSTSFTVQLDAASPGNYNGTVSFTNNDTDEGTYNFDVSGTVLSSVIIDDLESGFTTTGVWSTWVHSQFGHDGEHTYTASGDGSRVATWTFNSLTTGQYRVSATWFESANRATDSPFTLYDGAIPVTTVDINQQAAPDDRMVSGSDWEDLGIVSVTGSSLTVELTNDADGYVVADGILIERIGDLPAGPEITVTDANGGLVADGSGNVDFGSTNLNTAVSQTFTVVNAGNSTLTLNNGSFVLPSGFSLASGFGAASLTPGQSTSFTVQLDAASPGNYSGTVSFTNNDADEGTYDFSVSGVVTAQRIIDDLDSGFSTTGVWSTWVHSLYGYDGEHTYTASGDGSRIATWTFNSLTTGQYRVSASWFAAPNRATDSPFTLYDGATPVTTIDINQEVAPNDRMVNGANWEDLGIVTVTGSSLTVELTNDADDYVVADGILIEKI